MVKKINKKTKFGIFEIVYSIFIISLALTLETFSVGKSFSIEFILFILKITAYIIFLDGVFRIIFKMNLGELGIYIIEMFKI